MKTKLTLLTSMFTLLVCCIANAQWQPVNTGLTTNNVNAVLATGNNVLAGTDGGLFISSDNGDTWTTVGNSTLAAADVKALASGGGNVFAATFGGGIFLSADNGLTWTAKNTGFSFLYACAVATVGTTVYASMSFDGTYTSTDNGTTWTKSTNTVLNGLTVNSIITSGTNMIIGSGGCNGGTNGGVFLSTDGGATWAATSVIGDSPALAVIGTTVFAATQDAVFKSTDNGATWTMTANTSGIIDNAISLLVAGNTLLVGCPYSMYSSTNNGASWTDISTGAGGANLSVTSFTMNPTYVFAGNIYHSVGVWRRSLSEMGLTTGIAGLANDNSIAVYPNPVNDKVIVELSDYINTTVELFDLTGRLIQRIVLQDEKTTLNTNDLAPGSYILKFNSPDNSSVRRIIKN